MKHLILALASLAVLSCTAAPSITPETPDVPETPDIAEPDGLISAEKQSWVVATKSSDDRAFAKDIPWVEGDKVLLLSSKQSLEGCTVVDGFGMYVVKATKTLCTVAKASGLKCTLVPDEPLEPGTYRAFYPVYDYAWYDFLHLSFLYEDWDELDFKHQDIVVSDPVEYKDGGKLAFVMKHVCGLIDIDVYPPKSGTYSYLKLFAETTVFAGKADYRLDREYNIDEIASGWLNFTTLRGDGNDLKAGVVFPTSTGLLPVQYNGMPVCIHLIYTDGTHYVSAPIAMPSLKFGEAAKLEVRDFKETIEPMRGLWGDYCGDGSGKPYPVN